MASSTRSRTTSQSAESYESHFEHAALFEFSKVINSSLDLDFILSHILLTIMGKILSTKGMAVLAHGKGTFRVDMVKGFTRDIAGTQISMKTIPRNLFYVNKVNASRSPWIKFFKRLEVSILLPMYIAETPIGMLGFGERLSQKKLQSREETYLRSLANISATAIEKNHTIDELQQVNRKLDRKIQELNTLFELGKEFNALLDPEKLVRLLVFSLLGQIGISRYLVCLREGPDMRVVASRIEGATPQGELLRHLAKTKAATHVAEMVIKSGLDPRETLTAMGLNVIVPMQLLGDNKGLILLGEKLSREPFSQADLEFVYSLGNLAIISLENARLFKEALEKQKMEDELLIAREIQKGLLPSVLPDIPGFEIAAANVSSKQVGGDYYDVISTDDGRYIIAIGDVSGKGSPAALLMANLQATIRALVPLNLPLNELTERVNDLMCQNTGGNKFVTFFWGYLDPAKKTLLYVNAGHNYPYLVHEDGSMERLDKGGMILGVMKSLVPYELGSVHFRPHDLLVLFTDGVTEAMSKDSEEFSEERLETVLREFGQSSADRIAQMIHQRVQEFAHGAPQSDDITMMVVKVS